MKSSKDYTLLVHLLHGRPTHQVHVCATDAMDAHSQCWFKIDTTDHKHFPDSDHRNVRTPENKVEARCDNTGLHYHNNKKRDSYDLLS